MRSLRPFFLLGASVLAITFLAGCHSPSLSAQARASAPAMTFGEDLVWGETDRLGPQLESGRAFAGGGQSAGCTSCQ